MLALYIFVGALFFLYGVIIGSFLNVCILRIPRNETIVTTPSHCMSCGHKLAWYDLFPLFSYLFLGGKCRYCKTKISWQYPLVEFLNGVLYLITFLVMGIGRNVSETVYVFLICIFLSALLVLSGIDIRERIVPYKICAFILVLGIIATIIDYPNWLSHIIGLFIISLPMFILMMFNAMGAGDMVLYAAAGLFMGWQNTLLSFVFACLYGSVYSIGMFITKKAKFGDKTQIPFVPFIALGMMTAVLWGDRIINWYLGKFMIP